MKALRYIIAQCRLGQKSHDPEEKSAFLELEREFEERLVALVTKEQLLRDGRRISKRRRG